jgi:type IV pilus assembly protein PilQ
MKHVLLFIVTVLSSFSLCSVSREGFYYDDIVIPEKNIDLSIIPKSISNLRIEEGEEKGAQEKKDIQAIITNVLKGDDRDIELQAQALAKDSSKLQRLVSAISIPKKHKPRLLADAERFLQEQYDGAEFLGKKISLSLKNTNIVDVLDLIEKATHINFVLDADVAGKVKHINLKDVPVAQALRAILSHTDPKLALIKQGSIYRIDKRDRALEFAKYEVEVMGIRDFEKKITRMNNVTLTESFKLRVEKMWQGVTGKDHEKPGFYIAFDEGSKKIFYRGRAHHVIDFETYLTEIDIEIPQVKIEARIVIANKDFEESWGMQWSNLYNRRASINRGMEVVGSGPLENIKNTPGEQSVSNLMDWAFNFFPDAGVATRNIKIPFVFGGSDLNTKRLNLMLSAAENRDELKTILKPSILSNHGEEAEILVGESVPVETVVKETIEGSLRDISTARYIDVGTKLKVKPFVSPDNKSIFLDIYVENSSQTTPGKFPLITTTRSTSKVILKDGQTTMIGGLIENTKKSERSRLPFISDIPVFGWFFKGMRKEVVDHQLLIFITPTIV